MNGPCTVENPKQRSQYSGRGFRESLRLEVWECGETLSWYVGSVGLANARKGITL